MPSNLQLESEDGTDALDFPTGSPDEPTQMLPNLCVSESKFDISSFVQHKTLHEQLPSGLVIEQRYQLLGPIGTGSFGAAYRAEDLLVCGHQVVLKTRVSSVTEDGGLRFSENLQKELDIYMRLGAVATLRSPPPGIPEVFSAGVHRLLPSSSDKAPVYVSYIAMQSLGASLWRICHPKLPEGQAEAGAAASQPPCSDMDYRRWVVHTGKCMLRALASMHAMGCIHRDVKTENFCVERGCSGYQTEGRIYVIDYGFARPAFGYYAFHTYATPHASFWGTPNYSSLQSLLCYPQTPRDDLEALVYCLLELELRQTGCFLPWNSTLTTNSEAAAGWDNEQLETMMHQKRVAWRAACSKGLVPRYLRAYFDYISNLQAWHVIDYEWLLACLESGVTSELPWQPPTVLYRHWPDISQPYDKCGVAAAVLLEAKLAAATIVEDEELFAQLQQQEAARQEHEQQQQLQYEQQTESINEEVQWSDEGAEFNSISDFTAAAAGCDTDEVDERGAAGPADETGPSAAAGCSPSLCNWGAWGVCAHLSQPDDEQDDTATAPDGQLGGAARISSDTDVCSLISMQVPAAEQPAAEAQFPGRKRSLRGLLQPLLPAQQPASTAGKQSALLEFPGFPVDDVDSPSKKQRRQQAAQQPTQHWQ